MSRRAPLRFSLLFAPALALGLCAGEPAWATQAPGSPTTQERRPGEDRPADRVPHKERRKPTHPRRDAGTGSGPISRIGSEGQGGPRLRGFGGQGFGGGGAGRRPGGFGFGGRNFGGQGFRDRGFGGRNRGRGFGGYTGTGGGVNPPGVNPSAGGTGSGSGARRTASKSTTDLASEVEALKQRHGAAVAHLPPALRPDERTALEVAEQLPLLGQSVYLITLEDYPTLDPALQKRVDTLIHRLAELSGDRRATFVTAATSTLNAAAPDSKALATARKTPHETLLRLEADLGRGN